MRRPVTRWFDAAAIAALGVASALGVALGCGGHAPPGACGLYAETPGTARIVSIDPAPADEANCTRTPVRVRFDFTPSDPAKPELAARGVPLTIGAGYNPPQDWVVSSGLAVGSDHPAVRSDQPRGPCTPVVFRLTDVDAQAALAQCF